MVLTAAENGDRKTVAIADGVAAQADYGWIWKSVQNTTITNKLWGWIQEISTSPHRTNKELVK